MTITDQTRKVLWSRAHDVCAFPSCLQQLTVDVVAEDGTAGSVVVVGEQAHIRSGRPDGPRHDPEYPKQKLDEYENLLLLCATHHTMIDAHGGAGYSVATLERMKRDHENRQDRRARFSAAIRAYVADRYGAEDAVLFQQVDLAGPSVDAMFVDVPVGCRQDSPLADLLERIATEHPGDPEATEDAAGMVVTGATQALLHPDWQGNAVLVGGPGQGKSTVLQYLCQFHRARRLGKDAYSAGDSTLQRARAVSRIPIRVDLRRYAQWAPGEEASRRRGKKQGRKGSAWRSLEEFIVADIADHIGVHKFSNEDFVALIATEPILLALDGLDEVASIPLRDKVTYEIARVHDRLSADAANLVILVATRPGSPLTALNATGKFPVLYLRRLTQGLRVQYLRRWVTVSRLSEESAQRLQTTFMDHQNVPHIRELASYPMQLAILLHLLHRRQLLPQQRTELYREYLKTFLDREQTEDKEPLLADQRQVIEDTHAFLAWHLQTQAEEGNSSGSIPRDELRGLLRTYLTGQSDEQKLADAIYSAITTRVLCLIERDGSFEFEVQSLREYFAALYVFENLSPKGVGNSRDDGLNALLERPYWANVSRFFVGMLAKGEVRALKDNFRLVEKKVAPHPLMRSMAALVLNDRTYDGQQDAHIRAVVDLILDGSGVVLAEDGLLDGGGAPLLLSEKAGRAQAVEHLKARLCNEQEAPVRESLASSLARHAAVESRIDDWWWGRFQSEPNWVETAATLGAFRSLDVERTRLLSTAISATQTGTEWGAGLLLRGGYDGTDVDIMGHVAEDLNDGAASTLWVSAPDTVTGQLVRAASLMVARGHARRPLQGQAGVLVEHELGASAEFLAQANAALVTSQSPAQSAEDWHRRLAAAAAAWGDGWILRRMLSGVPPTADLAEIRTLHGSRGGVLTGALEDLALARSNAADADWWTNALRSATTSLQKRLWLLSVFAIARTAVVIQLVSEVDAVVGGLLPREYASIEATLKDAASPSRRELALDEPLRLNQIQPSAPTLWLLRMVGTAATKDRIDGRLAPVIPEILRAGAGDAELLRAARPSRRSSPETFEGIRSVGFPPGFRLPTLSTKLASEILRDPVRWPVEFVQIAMDNVASQRAKKVKPLAEVAAANRWFHAG